MSQFYTKTQVDQIATVIGSEIKGLGSDMVPAEDYTSFVSALDLAIGSEGGEPIPGNGLLLPSKFVVIRSPSGDANTNFSFTVNNGRLHNEEYDRIQDYWSIYRGDALMPDYTLGISLEENGILFINNNFEEDLTVKLMFNPNYLGGSDFEVIEGFGNITADAITGAQIITFKLAHAEFSNV